MSKRQYPKLNLGQHLGARAGAMGKPFAEAEAEFRAKENPTPHDIGEFRTGYVVGQINDRLNYLRSWLQYLNREELERMLADITPIVEKWGHTKEDES